MESSHNLNMLSNSIKMQILISRGNTLLRSLFLERWSKYSGKEWDSASVEIFVSGIGKKVYDKLQRIQRKSIESGDLNEWDLTTLTDVLILTDFPTDQRAKEDKSLERSKLEELKKVRNKLAHAPTLGIEDELFESLWKNASEVLMFFGCSNEDLDKIKSSSNLGAFQDENSSGHSSKSNSEQASKLKDEANRFYKNCEFEKAIEVYSKAISLGGLLDSELATLYSNRSVAYLASAGKDSRHKSSEELHCALQDGKEAVKLNPTWYRGYFRTGNAYFELGKFRKALEYFDGALSLSPGREELRQSRDNCRMKLVQETRQDHMNPNGIRLSESDEIKELKERLGLTESEEEIARAMHRAYSMTPGGSYVQRANNITETDPEMAAKLYGKAASLGNAEALFNLGLLHKDGRGVKQDFKMYYKFMVQATEVKPHFLDESCDASMDDKWIAAAQHSLGLAYEDGIGVIQDVATAADWYRKSSDNGCSAGSHNLALLYMSGRGVPNLDVERGVEYFKLAASRGNTLSMRSLAEHYLNVEEDPQQAREWFQLAVKHGNLNAQLDATEFEDKLNNLEIKNKSVEDMVRIYENQNGFSGEGMPLKNRLKRMKRRLNPDLSNAEEGLHSILSNSAVEGATPICKISRQFDPHVLRKYVKKGSQTAVRIQSAVSHFEVFWDLYHSHQSDLRKEGTKIIHELSECFRIQHIVAQITQPMKEQMFHLVGEVLKLNETSELDKDARVCYGYLQMDTLESTLIFMEHSKRKYPNEKALHAYYSDLCGFLRKHDVGIRALEKSLELFPNDVDLLYGKATHTRLLEGQLHPLKNILMAYEEFLAVAPPDHRWLPECYYSIVNEYFFTYLEKSNQIKFSPIEIMEGVAKMEEYRRLGQQAEKKQLPFFLPYVCDQKAMVENNQCVIQDFKSKFGKITRGIKSTRSNVKGQSKPEQEINYIKLCDPHRISIVKSHRESISECRDTRKTLVPMMGAKALVYKQRASTKLSGLKPITFLEMDTLVDKVYEGRVIQVTSIEDAGFNYVNANATIQLVLEDESGNVLRAFIYNFPERDEKIVQEKLGFGAKMSILNPYMRLELELNGKFGLRIDDVSSLILQHPATIESCRFCRDENAALRCGNCKWANYCSKKCQQMDWKLMKHKLICVPL